MNTDQPLKQHVTAKLGREPSSHCMKVIMASMALSVLAFCAAPTMADEMSTSSMSTGHMMMKQCMSDQKSMNSGTPMSDMKKTCKDKVSQMMKTCMDDEKSMNSSMSMSDMHRACDNKLKTQQ